MRKLTMIMFAALAAAAALATFADEPATTPAPAATSVPATTPDSKPAAATTATAPEQKTLAAADDAAKPITPPPGFKVKKKAGQILYCRETTPIGTRFSQETCMNEDQLKEFIQQAAAMQQDLYQHQSICAGAAACASN